MVRLVFRPYTQFRRQRFARQFLTTQASIKFSPDFTMSENSSPSFGSQQKCSIAQLAFLFFLKKKKKKEALVIALVKTSVPSWPVMGFFLKKKKRLTFFVVKLLSLRRMYLFFFVFIYFFFYYDSHSSWTPWSVFQDGSNSRISVSYIEYFVCLLEA